MTKMQPKLQPSISLKGAYLYLNRGEKVEKNAWFLDGGRRAEERYTHPPALDKLMDPQLVGQSRSVVFPLTALSG